MIVALLKTIGAAGVPELLRDAAAVLERLGIAAGVPEMWRDYDDCPRSRRGPAPAPRVWGSLGVTMYRADGDPKCALDKALDGAARAAEQALVKGAPLGLWLLPLDNHLAPRGTLRFPADQIPPTCAERRWLMECLVPRPLAGAAGYIVVAEGVSPSRNNGDPTSRADVILMQAETRAGDARVRIYPII